MADIALPCNCVEYINICCCEPQDGITVVQPACQTLPDGQVVNNPAYVPNLTKSFWTYKFITDCSRNTRAISNFAIPICELIIENNIMVYEKIDGCGHYKSVPFELTSNDPNFGEPPEGYQYLKIEINNRYEKGVSVEYRIEIIGDFPVGIEPIVVKASQDIYSFQCDECYLVPKCNPQGRLAVKKICDYTITNNQAVLNYTIGVDNVGNGILEDVQFQDNIFLSSLLGLGTIVVTPNTLSVNTSVSGIIQISGNLGILNPGQQIIVRYAIPIANVTTPGSYVVNNTATVSATGTIDSDSCNLTLNVVRLEANKCCSVENSTGIFTLTISSVGASPDILVDLFDHMEIPTGITVKFLELSGCEGYFSGTTNPIPLNTNITGPVSFEFICRNALVPSGSAYIKIGKYQLVSSAVVGTVTISNTITNVVPVNPNAQIFLGVNNIPVTADIVVQLAQVCGNPCL